MDLRQILAEAMRGIDPDWRAKQREQRAGAHSKALALFEAYLSPEQAEQYKKSDGILCVGSHSKQLYYLHCLTHATYRGYGYDVSRCRWPDRAQYYCSSSNGVPYFDRLLTKKLLIENNERTFTHCDQNCSGFVNFYGLEREDYSSDIMVHSNFWQDYRRRHNLPVRVIS